MDKARAMLKASGYKGEKVGDHQPLRRADDRADGRRDASTFCNRLGMNVELAAVDWATLTNRRANRESVEKGGWSIFHTWAPSWIIGTPVEHFALRGLGPKGWAGWFEDETIERRTRDWTVAATPEAQHRPPPTPSTRGRWSRCRSCCAASSRSARPIGVRWPE